MQWLYVAMSLAFAGLMACLSFALAYRQQETEWDCKIEGKDPPAAAEVWQLSRRFSLVAIAGAVVALLLTVWDVGSTYYEKRHPLVLDAHSKPVSVKKGP